MRTDSKTLQRKRRQLTDAIAQVNGLKPKQSKQNVNLYRHVTNAIYGALFVFEGKVKGNRSKRSYLNERQRVTVAHYEAKLKTIIAQGMAEGLGYAQIISNLDFYMVVASLNIQAKDTIKLN